MKNIVNVFILALTISLSFSVANNYSIIREISSMYDFMTYSADVLKEENDQKEKYKWNQGRLLKHSPINFDTKPELFTEEGKLVEEYFKNIDKNKNSTFKFYLEQERRSKLNSISPILNGLLFNERKINSSLDFSDDLYLGFHQSVFDNAIFEVSINSLKQEFSGSGQYICPIAPQLLIDLKKISINPKDQSLDTVCVSRFITRA